MKFKISKPQLIFQEEIQMFKDDSRYIFKIMNTQLLSKTKKPFFNCLQKYDGLRPFLQNILPTPAFRYCVNLKHLLNFSKHHLIQLSNELLNRN